MVGTGGVLLAARVLTVSIANVCYAESVTLLLFLAKTKLFNFFFEGSPFLRYTCFRSSAAGIECILYCFVASGWHCNFDATFFLDILRESHRRFTIFEIGYIRDIHGYKLFY